MTQSVRKFLNHSGYKFLSLDLETIGEWSPHDSEWNYSDALHFPYIHKSFSQKILNICSETNTSLFVQNLFFLKNPVIIYQEHKTKDSHEYLASSYGITISIVTRHLTHKQGAITKTNYQFFYSGFIGLLIAFSAKIATKNNYKKVISEDMPMRAQRGILRKTKNIFFKSDKNIVTPNSTLNPMDNNVFLRSGIILKKRFILDDDFSSKIFEKVFLRVSKEKNKIIILPTICPHEGSPLSDSDCHMRCKWHGRKIIPYISFNIGDSIRNAKFKHLNKTFIIRSDHEKGKTFCELELQK